MYVYVYCMYFKDFFLKGWERYIFFLKGWEKVRCLDISDNGGRKEGGGDGMRWMIRVG